MLASALRATSSSSRVLASGRGGGGWARAFFSSSSSAALERHGVPAHLIRTQAFIGGKFVPADGGATFAVLDPGSAEQLAEVADCGIADTQLAINAADAAFRSGPWSKSLAKDRAAVLRRWSALMLENTEPLARLMTLECGKPLAESRGEVAYAASFLDWFAEEARRATGSTLPHNMPGRRLLTIKQPVGVAAAITPWNFPAAMIARTVGPVSEGV